MCDCEVMVATKGGAAWVAGTVERFVPLNVGTEYERIGVDVRTATALHRNCWLGSVRLPREPDALDAVVRAAVGQ